MNGIDVTLLVLVLTLAAATGARRVPAPMPVVLAIAGVIVGVAWYFIPLLPPVRLPPQRVLLVFLPPLLSSAAYQLPLAGFWRNIRPIALLSVGLVVATTLVAGSTVHLVAHMAWAPALVVGAIVAPPDPVAATTIAGKTGLAHRLVVILEGEGLVNDAVAIVLYGLAVDAAVSGRFTLGHAGLMLGREVPIGVLVGMGIGWIVTGVRRRLDDVTLEAAISLVVPYLAYEVAERLHSSSVLAVVTLGFMLQWRRGEIASPAIRLATHTVWAAVRFASNALVFFLVGLLIGEIVMTTRVTSTLAVAAAALAGAVIVVRLAWMFAVSRLLRVIPLRNHRPIASTGELTVLGWAGMRGVVSLALALALPRLPAGTEHQDARSQILVFTFAVIATTLLAQGLTLGPLIRWLGVGDPERDARDEARVRRRARRAGLAALARAARTSDLPPDTCHALKARVDEGMIGVATGDLPVATPEEGNALLQALHAQREVVYRMRAGGRIGQALADSLTTEIDADATHVRGDTARLVAADRH